MTASATHHLGLLSPGRECTRRFIARGNHPRGARKSVQYTASAELEVIRALARDRAGRCPTPSWSLPRERAGPRPERRRRIGLVRTLLSGGCSRAHRGGPVRMPVRSTPFGGGAPYRRWRLPTALSWSRMVTRYLQTWVRTLTAGRHDVRLEETDRRTARRRDSPPTRSASDVPAVRSRAFLGRFGVPV